MSAFHSPSASAPATSTLPAALRWLIFGLIVYRAAYHFSYLGADPFALATFSDGRIYQEAAADILRHPPLGTEPFYLQGLYAYFMALGLSVRGWLGVVLLLQFALAAVTIWLFWRAARGVFSPVAAGLSLVVYLSVPAIAFYENKFLGASLGVSAMVLGLAALVAFGRRPTPARALGVGAAVGLCVLARGNLLLAVPFFAWGLRRVLTRETPRRRGRLLATAAVGLVAVLTTMAVRNAVVTDRATVFPAHGGGTSFYIGNNPHARGVWNDAGGLVTATVTEERDALAARLDLEEARDREGAIGRELYRRALAFARHDPAAFSWLQLRKVFLTLGNDELTQDYDWHGEREILGVAAFRGLPFSVVLGLGLLGAVVVVRRRSEPRVAAAGVAAGGLAVAVFVANVAFFTSAQHRMPLEVAPAFLAGPGLVALWRRELPRATVVVAALVVLQGFWPRSQKDAPSAVHYYNMAVVQSEAGLVRPAAQTMARAVAARPDHPLMRLEYARLLWASDQYDAAEAQLDWLDALEDPPDRVRDQSWRLRRAIAEDRGEQAAQ